MPFIPDSILCHINTVKMVRQDTVIRYLADCFQQDVDMIIKSFCQKQTFEFSAFSQLWKEANFSFVYLGRETEDELREFTEECFFITLRYFAPASSERLKVAALFLLYALYVKQPLEMKFRIRLQLFQWQELIGLFEWALEKNYLSVCFIFNKMLNMDAFHPVAHPRLMGPRVTLSSDGIMESCVENLKDNLKDYLELKKFKKIESIHNQYEAEKNQLFGADDGDLNLLMENKYEALEQKAVALIHTTQFERVVPQLLSDEECDGKIGERRTELKHKQYSRETTSKHVERCNELQEDISIGIDNNTEQSSEEVASSPEKKRPLRPKRKIKRERKRGRPRKIPIFEDEKPDLEGCESEEEEEEAVLLSGPKKKMQRSRKNYYHYNGDSDEDHFLEFGWM